MIGRHVQTRAYITVGAREDGLSFFRQQPIEINLGRVGMRRLVEKRKRSIRRTHVGTFSELPGVDDRNGNTLFGARLRDKIRRADEHRITALSDRVDLLRVVLKNGYLLLTQRTDEIHAELRVKIKKSKCRLSRPRSARIVHDQFALPFWIEQILVGLELPVVDELGIIENDAALERGHDHQCSVWIEKFQSPAAPGFWIFNVRENQRRLQRIERSCGYHRFEPRGRAMDENIPEISSGFSFGENPGRDLSAQGSEQVYLKTVLRLKTHRQGVAHRCRHVGDYRYHVFFLSRRQSIVPIRLPFRRGSDLSECTE